MKLAALVLLAAVLGLLGGAATLVVAAPEAVVEALERWRPEVLWSVETDRRAVALTIDDGPSARTGEILALLEAHDAEATFFVIGERVEARPGDVERMVEAGHEVGNHTMAETPSILLSDAELRESLSATDAILERWAEPRWFRPGSGWFDRAMLEAADSRGYRTALASMLPLDGWVGWPALVSAYVLARARPGAVLVLHDGPEHAEATISVLRRVLPELQRRGYAVVTVSDLVGEAEPDEAPNGARSDGAR